MELLAPVRQCRCGHFMNEHTVQGCTVYGCACTREPKSVTYDTADEY